MEKNWTGVWEAGLLPSAPACHFIHIPWNIGIPHESKIADASSDQIKLFKTVAKLLHINNDTPLSPCDPFNPLAEQFSDFFGNKSRKSVPNLFKFIAIYTDGKPQTCLLTAFEPATETEITVLLKTSPDKSCERDHIPSWLLRDCAHDIIPVLTTIVDMSLRIGVMPSHLKGAHVRPVIWIWIWMGYVVRSQYWLLYTTGGGVCAQVIECLSRRSGDWNQLWFKPGPATR